MNAGLPAREGRQFFSEKNVFSKNINDFVNKMLRNCLLVMSGHSVLNEKAQINLTFSQFCRDSTKEMQAFFCFRCSKIWLFAHLFVPLSRKR